MKLPLTLAWRYLIGRGARSLLTTVAVALGVMLTFGLNGISPAMEAAFTKNLLAAAGTIDLTVTDASGQPFSATVADRVERVAGVGQVSPELSRAVILPQTTTAAADLGQVTVIGVDPALADGVRDLAVSSGRRLVATDRYAVVMNPELATKLAMVIGDELTVPAATGTVKLRLVGLLSAAAVPGSEQIFVPLATAQQLFSLSGKLTAVQASVATGADRTQVEQAVSQALGSDFSVGGLSSDSSLLASLQVTNYAFAMFSVFALATAGFIILNSFRTLVAERRRDIGMLRAIGAGRRTVLLLFLIESCVQGILGTVLGLLLGWGMAAAFFAAMAPTVRSVMHLDLGGPIFTAQTWTASIVLGLGVTVLAALVPARAAARISPLEAMRPVVAGTSGSRLGRPGWIGLGLLAVSCFGLFSGSAALVGGGSVLFLVAIALLAPVIVVPAADWLGRLLTVALPSEGAIARGNLQRNPARSGITVTVVMLGLASIVAMVTMVNSIFAGFIGYLDRSMSADYLVLPQSIVLSQGNVAAGPALARRIEAVAGVADVATLRLAQARVGDTQVQVIGIDPASYLKVGSFDWSPDSGDQAVAQLTSGRWVIANGIFAAQHGLVSGDSLVLQTTNGPRSYLVAGIGNDYLNAKLATVYTSQVNLARDFDVNSDLMILANRSPGADAAQVQSALSAIVADYSGFRLYESASWKAQQLQTFNASMVIFDVLIAALAVPSLLALANTMAISVLSRTRELGMLRAIGATRGQVRRMITAESLLLSGIGTVLGLVAGLWLGYALVAAMAAIGWPMPFSVSWSGMAVAVVVGIGFGVLAARRPARMASELQVVAALHQE